MSKTDEKQHWLQYSGDAYGYGKAVADANAWLAMFSPGGAAPNQPIKIRDISGETYPRPSVAFMARRPEDTLCVDFQMALQQGLTQDELASLLYFIVYQDRVIPPLDRTNRTSTSATVASAVMLLAAVHGALSMAQLADPSAVQWEAAANLLEGLNSGVEAVREATRPDWQFIMPSEDTTLHGPALLAAMAAWRVLANIMNPELKAVQTFKLHDFIALHMHGAGEKVRSIDPDTANAINGLYSAHKFQHPPEKNARE